MSEHITQQFNDLYDEYSNTILRLCLYKTSNRDTALDLTQDTFVKLFSHIQNNGLPENPKSFLYQIARNTIIDHYRKHSTQSLDAILEEGFDFEESTYGYDASINNSQYGMVINCMKQLDEKYREAIYLRLVEDMSVKDIALMLGISESNTSVRISRGREQLQKMLD